MISKKQKEIIKAVMSNPEPYISEDYSMMKNTDRGAYYWAKGYGKITKGVFNSLQENKLIRHIKNPYGRRMERKSYYELTEIAKVSIKPISNRLYYEAH